MPVEDEIRALRRELASGRVREDAERRAAVVAQLKARGADVGDAPVEKAVKRSGKKAAE